MRSTDALVETRRYLEICNACRYCEGFCAVFPAMERRREFSDGDIGYLANLCHNCRGCYFACQYAPPHPFGLNLPKAFAEVRSESYQDYAWPQPLARLYRSNGVIVALVTALCLAGLLLLARLLPPELRGLPGVAPGAFYAVVPHWAMVVVAGLSLGFSIAALVAGFRRFWADAGRRSALATDRTVLRQAVLDVLTLRNLGEEHGCNDRDEAFSSLRRRFHHALFYGFLGCLASTVVAALYEVLFGIVAPFGPSSLPVLLGTFGGLGILVGCCGMLWLKTSADPAPNAMRLLGGELAFILLLALTSASGLGLLFLRATSAMPGLLVLHLGFVLAFFLLLPYSKFVHGVYRAAALLRNAIEAREMAPTSE